MKKIESMQVIKVNKVSIDVGRAVVVVESSDRDLNEVAGLACNIASNISRRCNTANEII